MTQAKPQVPATPEELNARLAKLVDDFVSAHASNDEALIRMGAALAAMGHLTIHHDDKPTPKPDV